MPYEHYFKLSLRCNDVIKIDGFVNVSRNINQIMQILVKKKQSSPFSAYLCLKHKKTKG